MLQERRDNKRSLLTGPIRYQRKGSQSFGNSVGHNISEGGIGFLSHEFFPVATQLIFELQHPGSREYVKTTAEIAWISQKPHSENFLVGAKFIEPLTSV
jgi:hypothetical protein